MECIRGPAPPYQPPLQEKESSRPHLYPPETFPRSSRQIREDEREEAKRATQTQTWTSTTHGLREGSRSCIPQKVLCRVSPIQCGLCRTYRIPALQFFYRCFPQTAVNCIVKAASDGGRIEYRCIVCFVRKASRTEIHKQGFDVHIPQKHVNYRYPFSSAQLWVIAGRDEDRYNNEVRPRTLPLKDGIFILRENPANDPDGAAGLNWYSPPIYIRADWRVPWPAPPKPEGKMCKTRSSQFCRNPGCTMLCGNAAMEDITPISSSTPTLFQMQQATNRSKPFPFPTVRETAILEDAYNSVATRGCPMQGAITALMKETGVGVQYREAAASIDMRTQLPTPVRRPHPTFTYVLLRKEEDTETRQGEYYEEEIKVDESPSWMEPPSGSITLYAYGREYATAAGFPILDTTPLPDRTDTESQESGIGGTRNTELDIKDHGIKGCSATPEPQIPARNGRMGPPRCLSTRDPRASHVSVANPSSLYSRSGTPMVDLQNIAHTGAADKSATSSDGEEKLVILLGDE